MEDGKKSLTDKIKVICKGLEVGENMAHSEDSENHCKEVDQNQAI